jgi:N-methylhydantoinase B
MRKMIADSSKVFGERLETIPDGRWSERLYLTGLTAGDRDSHVEMVTFEKRGDKLTVSNAGTSPQAGAGNSPYAILRAAVISALNICLAYDQQGCVAGVANHVFFEPVPGTRNVPTHPAAVSGILSTMVSVNLAGVVTAKMLLAGPPEVRLHAMASGAMALPLASFAIGINEAGEFIGVDGVSGGTPTCQAGGFGAFPHRDGVDAGGSWWLMNTTSGNVEEMERAGMMLALYRAEKRDSGGPGRWRGGNSMTIATLKHKIATVVGQFSFADPSASAAIGLGGGFYGLGGNYLRATGIDDVLAAGRMVGSREDVEDEAGGELERLHPRTLIESVPAGDCLITEYNGGGGYGDPLLREPELVAGDVLEQDVSREQAERHWGVLLDGDGAVERTATEERRTRIRKDRLREGTPPSAPSPLGNQDHSIPALIPGAGGSTDIVSGPDGPRWACSHCGADLGSAGGSFKQGCAVVDREGPTVDPLLYPDPKTTGDPDMIVRQHMCPACGTLVAQEFCRRADPPHADILLFLDDGAPLTP